MKVGLSETKRRARKRKFDAKDVVPCAQNVGEELGECDVGVARGTGKVATVVATFSNGFRRRLYFEDGEFVAANTTMSGTGRDTEWELKDGVHNIRVDDQRYEITDALIFGDSEPVESAEPDEEALPK